MSAVPGASSSAPGETSTRTDTFASRLRAARRAAGLSQTDLAGEGCSVSFLSRLESGSRIPSAKMAAYLEQRLHMPRGALSAREWGLRTDKYPDTRHMAEIATRAHASWDAGNLHRAQARAREGIQLALELDLPVSWYDLATLDIRVSLELGHVHEAATAAANLEAHPWVRSFTDLHAQTCVLAAAAALAADDGLRAHMYAIHARDLTNTYDPDDMVRRQALTALAASEDRRSLHLEQNGHVTHTRIYARPGADDAVPPHPNGADAYGDAMPLTEDLSTMSTSDLLQAQAAVAAEITRRGLTRTRNGLEIVELLVARALDGRLAPANTPGWDVELRDGSTIQVKARALARVASGRYYTFSNFDFDQCAFVRLDPDTWNVLQAVLVPRHTVEANARPYRGKYRVPTSAPLHTWAGARDLAHELNDQLDKIDAVAQG